MNSLRASNCYERRLDYDPSERRSRAYYGEEDEKDQLAVRFKCHMYIILKLYI